MADKKKSILDEALLDAKRIQEALNANSKEILRSVTKEEIDNLVKESLKEDYTEEDVDNDELEGSEDMDAVDADIDADADVDVAPDGDIDIDADVELDEPADDEIEDLEIGDDLEGDYDSSMDAEASDDEVEMDMTMASDEDVISVYKKLTGDDEIEVVIDDEAGEVKLTVNEPGEFVIKTGEGSGEVEADLDLDDMDADDDMDLDDMGGDVDVDLVDVDSDVDVELDDMDSDDEIDAVDAVGMDVDDDMDAEIGDEEENEVLYEIALDEMDAKNFSDANDNTGDLGFDENQPYANEEGDMVMNEKEVEESDADLTEDDEVVEGEEVSERVTVGDKRDSAARAKIGQPKGAGAKKLEESKVKYNTLLTEAKELKSKNGEYKQALKQFRTMLAETVVFNANLTYVTKLFMEHSTSKDEKQVIFERFDNEVSTLKESKKLYKTIASEMVNRKPMNESVGDKMIKEVTSSSSKQLNESTVYVDKETSRIMDLMKRVDNK